MKIKARLNKDDSDIIEFWGDDEKNLWCVSNVDIFWDLDISKRIYLSTDFIRLDVIVDHQGE